MADPIAGRVTPSFFDSVYNSLGAAPYEQVLNTVQQAISNAIQGRVDTLSEAELKEKIERYISDHGVKCALTDKVSELANYIYHDMAGYSFITREGLFDLPGFEELDINSWDCVEIIISGKRQPTNYRFLSPSHALDIHLRIMRVTGTVFNDATPRATADIGPGIRITALKTPLVDENVAIVSSIRKVNTSQVSKEKLLQNGTLTPAMMSFLLLCLEHGVSMSVSGETGAGKTTLAGCLLDIVTRKLRTYSIEEGSREWDFTRRDEDGKVLNSIIHTKTRPSDDKAQHIDQEQLVKDSLRFNPSIIAPGEIRGREAYEVMEVSNTGHTVITTTHSNSTMDTPGRIVGLAKKAYNMDDSTLFTMACQAFPILVHIEACADRVRRVTEIREVIGFKDGAVASQMLFEFEVSDNIYDGETCIRVEGGFRQINAITDRLRKWFLKKGTRRAELEPYTMEPATDKEKEGGNSDVA